MTDAHLDAKLLMDMFGQMLCTIDRTVLTTRTAKAEHQTSEATLDITTYMGVGQLIDAIQERQYLTIVLQETDNGFVQTCQLLIRLITARVVRATAVEDIATTIAALILRNALGIREAIDAHHQRSLGIVLGERGRTILRVGLVGVQVCRLVTIGTTDCSLHILELRQLRQAAQHTDQIRIGEVTLVEQLTDILHSRRNRLDEVGLALEVATETIGTQHLQLTEQHKQAEALNKAMGRRHLGQLFQGIIVLIDQLATQLVRILCRGLPQERR